MTILNNIDGERAPINAGSCTGFLINQNSLDTYQTDSTAPPRAVLRIDGVDVLDPNLHRIIENELSRLGIVSVDAKRGFLTNLLSKYRQGTIR